MLRDLRKAKGITGMALAALSNLSQSAISKLENGKSGLPEWKRIMVLLRALDASDDEIDSFRRQYELAQLDPSSYKYMVMHGVDERQRHLARLEESAHFVRDFQSAVVPGLLQTPSYAYRVFRLLGHDDDSSKQAVRERQLRQVALNDPSKKFYFVIMDCAIFSVRIDISEHIQQLKYLLNRSGADNISLRILDSRRGVPVSLPNAFMIVDRRYVTAEEAIRELTTSTPVEVEEYERLFAELGQASLDEMASFSFIEDAIGVLQRGG